MIGIDIGTKYIKLASLEKKEEVFYIRCAAMGVNPSKDPSNRQDALLSAKIKEIAKNNFPFEKRAASSVGGCQIIARNFELASLGGEEMEGAVLIEAKQSISADLSSMYTDWQALAAVDKGKKDTLFIAVPPQLVDRNVHIIENSGLYIEIMDIDNLAAANCYISLDKNAAKQSVILLNSGSAYTNIAVIDSGALRFVRNVNFGGSDITSELAAVYKLPFDTAEEIKKRPELWKELGVNIKNILRKSMPELLEAVYRSMEYCMGHKKILNIDKILITGGTSNLWGLDFFMADALGIVSERWNPLDHIECGVESKKQLGPVLTVALGLAVREWQKS